MRVTSATPRHSRGSRQAPNRRLGNPVEKTLLGSLRHALCPGAHARLSRRINQVGQEPAQRAPTDPRIPPPTNPTQGEARTRPQNFTGAAPPPAPARVHRGPSARAPLKNSFRKKSRFESRARAAGRRTQPDTRRQPLPAHTGAGFGCRRLQPQHPRVPLALSPPLTSLPTPSRVSARQRDVCSLKKKLHLYRTASSLLGSLNHACVLALATLQNTYQVADPKIRPVTQRAMCLPL